MQTDSHPAFSRIPPWVKAKLRPIATERIQQVYDWVETECIPAERIYKAQLKESKTRWETPAIIHDLRKKAKAQGLWNLFLPNHFVESPGLTNLEYSCCAEIMGRVYWAAQVSSPPINVTSRHANGRPDNELPCARNWKHRAPR